jgi:hypothetical protein
LFALIFEETWQKMQRTGNNRRIHAALLSSTIILNPVRNKLPDGQGSAFPFLEGAYVYEAGEFAVDEAVACGEAYAVRGWHVVQNLCLSSGLFHD